MNSGIAQHPWQPPGFGIQLDLELRAQHPLRTHLETPGQHRQARAPEEAHTPRPKIVLGIHKMSHLISRPKISQRTGLEGKSRMASAPAEPWPAEPRPVEPRPAEPRRILEELWEADPSSGSVGRAEPELRMMMQRCSCGISGPARSGKCQKSHEAQLGLVRFPALLQTPF